MRFKKSSVILVVLILITTIFTCNTSAIKTQKTNIFNYNKFNHNGLIIEFIDEPVLPLRNKLRIVAKYLLSNFTENIKHNFIVQKIKSYKEKLVSLHRTFKEDILKLVDNDVTFEENFSKEFFELFNGICIKNISEEVIPKIKNLSYVKDIFPNSKISIG